MVSWRALRVPDNSSGTGHKKAEKISSSSRVILQLTSTLVVTPGIVARDVKEWVTRMPAALQANTLRKSGAEIGLSSSTNTLT